jgi:hypothetical protein
MTRGIQAPRQRFEGTDRSLVLLLVDDAHETHALFLQLFLRENRREKNLREDVQEHFDVSRERRGRDVHADGVRRGRRDREARSSALELFGDLELRPVLGSLRELSRGHRSEQAAVGRREKGAGVQRPRDRDRRVEPVLESEEARAVGEGARANGFLERDLAAARGGRKRCRRSAHAACGSFGR